jgi:hypothetical protein
VAMKVPVRKVLELFRSLPVVSNESNSASIINVILLRTKIDR